MKLKRRRFLYLAAGAAAFPAASRLANTQTYPNRPVRFIVSFAAGGPNDIVARLVGQFLSEKMGQQFVIENKVGAGGNIGMQAVLGAPPDGYTIGFVTPNNAINATLYDNLPFDFIRDSTPVAGLMRLTNVMVVPPSLPVTNVAEFIAYVKANPAMVNMASGGTGTSPHMSGELFKQMAGINMIHVPYRGTGPAMNDLLPGRVQVMFDNLPGSIEHIRTGKLRALGVTVPKRWDALPDVPAIAETLPGYEVTVWYGISAPKATPPDIVENLNAAVTAVLADPKLKLRLAGLGGVSMPILPAEFGKLIADETEKWAKVVKLSGVKPE
ncbi:MAG TPA: tripartite tricarboxylate transporter substrate binding protein [Xanthobacteraceae bacterium]|nr:tripartite tricarboxylate transporter substrate binding protein [Xanthobacteraceae bacterium]